MENGDAGERNPSYPLIQDPGKKPLFLQPAKLIGARTGTGGVEPYKEPRHPAVLPLRVLPPPAYNIDYPVETFPPDEGGYHFVSILMDSYRFTNNP